MRAALALPLSGLLVATLPQVARAQVLTDELYNSHHPRLLMTAVELPALQAKLFDGGLDDATYQRVRDVVENVYPNITFSSILGPWYGEFAIPCTGLVGHLEGAQAADALELGKELTLHIASTYNPDNDEAHSGMRLRALVLGYDLCFGNATVAERTAVRDEIVLYMQKMVWTIGYQLFEQRPYLGNHSAMFAAPLGMAAIALQGETDTSLCTNALAMADRIVENLLRYIFDPDGAYNEGAFYAAWTLKQLVYYFDARRRFDGFDYSGLAQLRGVEQWLCYEIAPEGEGRAHNLNDSPLYGAPLAIHPTFFNWAVGMWDSGLSAWLWNHTAGSLGAGAGNETDWTGAILWQRPVTPVEPGVVLPHSRLWTRRGLYYYRSGWQSGENSNDVVFSFYSGKFQGGHAQEDQNQFSLTAYGTTFAMDHGAGNTAKQSESHNMIFIDGKGQHNAGSSIGTDGKITDYLLGDFADFVAGDATAAYTTYSAFNSPNFPITGSDWSWGYGGANPVDHALRRVLVVHGAAGLPYVVIMDDIDKDGATHDYEWRLHTAATNTIAALTNPVSIAGTGATLAVHLLEPGFSSVSITTQPYDPGNQDPNSTLLRIVHTTVNPRFTVVMIPRPAQASAPSVTHQAFGWGSAATITWGAGVSDLLIRNDSGAAVDYGGVTTDATTAVIRKKGNNVQGYLVTGATLVSLGQKDYVTIANGPTGCEFSGTTLRLDRYDADFRFLDTGIERVMYREQSLGFITDNGYIVSDGVTGVERAPDAATLSVGVHPNPFNPVTMIRIEGVRGELVHVAIFDVEGRRIRDLFNGLLDQGRAVNWDGRNDAGAEVSSGTYFVRVVTPSRTGAAKLTLVK